MPTNSHTFFDTPIGLCGLAWNDTLAVTHFALPEASDAITRQRLPRKAGGAEAASPPREIILLVERVRNHLAGQLDPFLDVELDLTGVIDFARDVYDFSRRIPPGGTRTYGEVATAIGQPGSAQAVGHALGRNPIPLIVPCHRIVAAGGRPGGFSAPGGTATKSRLLQIEGALLF
jgi:methylated-DNA-[protein]-cysteine S-methyltransferase